MSISIGQIHKQFLQQSRWFDIMQMSEKGKTDVYSSIPGFLGKSETSKSRPYYSPKIDLNRTIEHYQNISQSQYQSLAQINMSAQLKRELFDFQIEDKSVTDNIYQEGDLVIESHPLRGKIIHTKRKWKEINHKDLQKVVEQNQDLNMPDKLSNLDFSEIRQNTDERLNNKSQQNFVENPTQR